MRRHTSLTIVALVVGLAALSSQAALVSYWAMNEGSGTTVANQAGGGLNGTLFNSAANTWVAGRDGTGYAVNFNGTNQYMDAGTNAALDAINKKLTLSTWFKSTMAGGWYRSIGSKFGDTGTANFWGLGWEGANQIGFVVRDTGNTSHIPNAPVNVGLDGQWHHLLGVRDKGGSNKVSYFLDGDLVDQIADTIGDMANTRPFQLARHGGGSYVAQTVDDMAIWDQALNPYQVRALARGQTSVQNAASVTNEVLRDGPVAYWRFEESRGVSGVNLAADSTGKGRTGTFAAPTVTVPRHMEFDPMNRAARFDGTDDYVTLPTMTSSDFGGANAYSVELWFNPASLHQGDLVSLSNGGGHMFLLELQTNGQIRFLHRTTASSSGGVNIYSAANSYAANQWYHLAAVNNLGTMYLYLNGQQIGTTTGADSYTQDLSGVLGRIQPGDSARSFQGMMDEVAFYNYALSADEIREHMTLAVPEPASMILLGLAGAGLGRYARRRRASR